MNVERGLVKTRLGCMHYRAAGATGSEAIFLQHINQQSSALYLELMAVLARKRAAPRRKNSLVSCAQSRSGLRA